MDTEKQNITDEPQTPDQATQIETVEGLIENKSDEVVSSDLSSPEPHPLDDIFKQRHDHRNKVLSSILNLLWASFWLLAGILITQSLIRIFCNSQFVLLDEITLRIIAVSIFGQVIGVVYVITRSLFDDKIYMDLFKDK